MASERARQCYERMGLNCTDDDIEVIDAALAEERKATAVEACKMMLDFWHKNDGLTSVSETLATTHVWFHKLRKHFNLTDADFQKEERGG